MDLPKIGELDYRGEHVDFYDDDYGQSVVAVWRGEEYGMGTYNVNYEDDVKWMIDEKLDLIDMYDGGYKLKWYDNMGYRDIILTHRGRIVYIWLVADPDRTDVESVKRIAKEKAREGAY